MKSFWLLLFITTAYAIPQRRRIDANRLVKEALNTPLIQDASVKAPVDKNSPSAAAALAYMKSVAKDGLCGLPTEVYIQTIFNGNSKEQANAEATKTYIDAYNNGERLPKGGACAAADVAWREAWRKEGDPVLESALAFINAWPGVKDGNPCAVSGICQCIQRVGKARKTSQGSGMP